jgi:predicted phosphodiesterase
MQTFSVLQDLSIAPDRRDLTGPFDIIGDVHGCADELEALLAALGYEIVHSLYGVDVRAPGNRRIVFVGDLVDRGPDSPRVLDLAMSMISSGDALAVAGNHDAKLLRHLEGRKVMLTHGLDLTVAQLGRRSPEFLDKVRLFLSSLPSHAWLDRGRLAVAHAGIKDHMLGETTKEVRRFCLYGDTSGETDDLGLPVRYHWAADYRGTTSVIYGHTPVPEAAWVNNTMCLDTGCCFGGRLSALRWPERRIVSVPAARVHVQSRRPFGHPPVRPRESVATG